MKIYKTKKYKSWIRIRNHLDITTTTKKNNEKIVQYVQRPNESGAKRKTTITLKLKQVCATLRQQVHTGIAMVYTRIQSHIAAYLHKKYIKSLYVFR